MVKHSCDERYQAVQSTIHERKTFKVIGDTKQPIQIPAASAERNRPLIMKSIADAGMAPFHYDRNHQSIAEPWRFHVIWHEECRMIAASFLDWFEDVKPSNKLPSMLAACGALVLVNWLPQQDLADADKATKVNEEHLAATSAAVQNLLLLLTAQGFGTYWSSGGQFRTQVMFQKLGIPTEEKLLAAVFIEFPETMDVDLERLPGKQRSKRSSVEKWTREVEMK